METKLKLDLLNLDLELVCHLEDDDGGVIKEESYKYKTKDFMDCYTIYAREWLYRLSGGQDITISGHDLSGDGILDFYCKSYINENGEKIYPRFWLKVYSNYDEYLDLYLIAELFRQNIKMESGK